jgi:AbrB family looped-hinge helix DNA binding protein
VAFRIEWHHFQNGTDNRGAEMGELVTDVKIAANGRLVLPRAVRKAMGVEGETRLIVTVKDGEVTLVPISSIVEKVQRIYRENVVNDFSSDDFLADRRAEEESANRRGR